jgi:glutamine amidotransferase
VSAPSVVVLDYGSGNLRSAERALRRVGAGAEVTSDLSAARRCDGLVVPGVGAFAACMQGLEDLGAPSTIRDRLADGRPVLAICVGMQVLFDSGEEHGVQTKGLGLLPGEVRRLRAEVVPHMGWNTVVPAHGSVLFAGIDTVARFYFVHSYAAMIEDLDDTAVSTARHGETFAAAVEQGPLSATQFHPEKSGDAGAELLDNWVRGLR